MFVLVKRSNLLDQLSNYLKFTQDNRYLTEERRKNLALELDLNENQVRICYMPEIGTKILG